MQKQLLARLVPLPDHIPSSMGNLIRVVLVISVAIALIQALIPCYGSYGAVDFGYGRYKDAIPHLELYNFLYPHESIFEMMQGQCYVKVGETERGIRELRLAMKDKPDDFATLTYLADALAQQGHIDEARKDWKAVLKVAVPGNFLGVDAAEGLKRYPEPTGVMAERH